MKLPRLAPVIAAVALVLMPFGSSAADGDTANERIESFDSAATLAGDGSMSITETIAYDFGVNARHGIYRDIPFLSDGPDGKRYRLGIDVRGVTIDGGDAETDEETENGAKRIKIGDEDETITGRHTYVIRYRIDRIVLSQDNRLLFDVTGNAWQVPIESARLSLSYPGGGEMVARCFTGAAGSATSGCQVTTQAGGITVASNGSLQPGEGLTLDARLPDGAVSGYLAPYVAATATPAGAGLLGLTGLAVVGGWVGYGMMWARQRRRRLGRTVVAQYNAPNGYKPADMGFLIDEQTGRPEVAATIIDLAIRGYLTITPVKKTGLLGHDDFKLSLKDATGLPALDEVERGLLDGIMNGSTAMNLRDVDKAKSSAAVGRLYDQIARRLTGRGIYDRPLKASQRAVPPVLLAVATAIPVIATGIILSESPAQVTALVALAIVLVVACGLVWLALHIARRQPRLSTAGVDELAYLRGLKVYLSVAEKDRLDFTDAPDRTPERFNELLPFAVALGVERQWAEQFKGIDIAPAVGGWYAGDPGTLSAVYLASSLNSFSSGVQSSIAAPSSGGAGGGFSGGGFGGGGGGSW